MNNNEKLINSFATALNLPVEQIVDGLKYQSIKAWDSISHMVLITTIEDDFGISLETDDVIDMSSVAKAKEILTKYNVTF